MKASKLSCKLYKKTNFAPYMSLNNKYIQAGITPRGVHAFRRTVNSKMRCEGVSATVAAALLGHSPDVNEQYYTYDISNIEEKPESCQRLMRKYLLQSERLFR